MAKFYLACCVLLIWLVGAAVAHSQDPDAPFLFYYDEDLHSFVLERADGHDYRLFLADTLPQDARMQRSSWSPDGARSAIALWFGGDHYEVWVADHAGEIIARTEAVANRLLWSPNNRFLLLAECLRGFCADDASHRILLFDVNQERVVNQYEQRLTDDPAADSQPPFSPPLRLRWWPGVLLLVGFALSAVSWWLGPPRR